MIGFLVSLLALMALLAPERSLAEKPGFYGVVPQAPLTEADVPALRGAGVGAVRLLFNWSAIERAEGEFDFSSIDPQMKVLADAGIEAMPFVYGTPGWLESQARRPPLRNRAARSAWRKVLRKLVRRYGPDGSLTKQEGSIPIGQWQVWNEPNLYGFWRPKPNPRAYGRLLEISAKTIRSEDRGAEIVLAGLPPAMRGIDPAEFLRKLLRVPGVKRSFDLAAFHPYAADVKEMLGEVRELRRVLKAEGVGGKRAMITEFGWASDGYPDTKIQTLQGQAKVVGDAYDSLVLRSKRWRLARVFWFAWKDRPNAHTACPFCPAAGLLDPDGNFKPSWYEYRERAKATPSGR